MIAPSRLNSISPGACVNPGVGADQRGMGAERRRHDRRDGFQDGDVVGVERSAPRLAEEAADAPGLPGGAEHHPQLVVVALRLQEVAVAGAAHRPVVGGRAQGRRRGVAPGEVGEEVGVVLVELPEPEGVAVAVVEVLHAGGRHGEQRRGVEAEPHGPVVGDDLADLRGHALQELVGVGRPGGDPLDGVDDTRQQPARHAAHSTPLGPIVDPPSWGVLVPPAPRPGGAAATTSARPRDRRPAPRGATYRTTNQPEGADHARHRRSPPPPP